MKIAVIGQRWNPQLNDGVILGGGEITERFHAELLGRSGHEVHFITGGDSEDLPFPGVTTHKLVTLSKKVAPAGGPRGNRGRNLEVMNVIPQIDPDVILVEDMDNQSLYKMLLKGSWPATIVVLSPVESLGFFTRLGSAACYRKMVQEGHTVAACADVARQNWHTECRKMASRLSPQIGEDVEELLARNNEAFLNEVLHLPISTNPERPPVQETERGFVMVCRMVPHKRIHWGLKALAGSNHELTLYTTMPGNESSEKYAKSCKRAAGSHHTIMWGRPHAEIMDAVGKSKALLMFSDESFGIIGVEANLRGVPVILGHPHDVHPTVEACAPGNGLTRVPAPKLGPLCETLPGFLDTWAFSSEQRRQLADASWDYYSPEATAGRLVGLLERCIQRYNAHHVSVDAPPDIFSLFS